MLENQGGVESYEDTVNDLAPDTKLMYGQYTISQYLSSGGFGITYLANDSLNRLVVIKECFPSSFCRRTKLLVRPHSRENAEELTKIVSLFTQEALSLARVEHPNIVGVHQVFEENNTAYMALDYIRGRDLQDIVLVNQIEMKPEQVTSILTKILDAIGHVHKNGLLHRDISPDNIIVRDDGEPVLIDFGAAREQSTRKTRVLSAMQIVKDGYSPQEFYVAESNQSPSCDLYSLAATFYHIITGERPPDAQRRITALASREPDPYRPLLNMDTEYDASFCAILDKALQVLPKDRVQSAEEWLAELGRTGTRRRISKRVLEPEVIPSGVTEAPKSTASEDRPIPRQPESDNVSEPIDVTNVEQFAAFSADPPPRARPQTTVKQPIELAAVLTGAPVEFPDTEAPNDNEAEVTGIVPMDIPVDEPAAVGKRTSSRILLPSIVSVQGGTNDERSAIGGSRGTGPRFLATALLAGVAMLGAMYLMRDTNFQAAVPSEDKTLIASMAEPAADPKADTATEPAPTTNPEVAATSVRVRFPDTAAPIFQDRPAVIDVAVAPFIQVDMADALSSTAQIESSDIAWPAIEQVEALSALAALPQIAALDVALPQTFSPPLAVQTTAPSATDIETNAVPSTRVPQGDVAQAQESFHLIEISDEITLGSKLVDEQWVTSVISASSDSVLRIGDIIIADAATGNELNSPESVRAMLEATRADGGQSVDLAIERNGAFRLENLKL